MVDNIEMIGNVGNYMDEHNVFSFQYGSGFVPADRFFTNTVPGLMGQQHWLSVQGYNVAMRGWNNLQCEELESDIKKNRLLPKLINKQCTMLYGHGPFIYKRAFIDNKIQKQWIEVPQVQEWLNSWDRNGMQCSYIDFAKSIIKNYYYYHDFFVMWRMAKGKLIGRMPIAGMETQENKYCRLATIRQDVATQLISYSDFGQIILGNWAYGAANFKVYPRLDLMEVDNINYAGISHHRDMSPGDVYGLNETHSGALPYIKASNDTPNYINAFLKNSLAAKIHVIIPNAWIEAKRAQITTLCEENKKREKLNQTLLTYNDIVIGTSFKESTLIQYMQSEMRKLSKYLSGVDNQGKAYASISFITGQQQKEQRWQIETVDLKYKEYIEALISYDKRADEVMLSSVGMDSSISAISKDGVISKSGADVYYNYLIYLMQLEPDDQKCSEPFNWALRLNFPDLYRQGYRFGYYRELPQRQEDISPNNRLNKQQV